MLHAPMVSSGKITYQNSDELVEMKVKSSGRGRAIYIFLEQ